MGRSRRYDAIAYGGGNAFRQSAGQLSALLTWTTACGAHYLGDLDPAGVEILLGVQDQIPNWQLTPHCGLYRWLLAHGHRRPLETVPTAACIAQLDTLFPHDIVAGIFRLWSDGRRTP